MSNTGSPSINSSKGDNPHNAGLPLWLLAELTYRCPLQCPYCSNPLDFAKQGEELSTQQWMDVLEQGRAMGAAQLGFSGGEPLVRQDLAELIKHARGLGYYTNLITSGIGLTEAKVDEFKKAGLDHIQISFQASDETVNNALAGSHKAFANKLAMAKAKVWPTKQMTHLDGIIKPLTKGFMVGLAHCIKIHDVGLIDAAGIERPKLVVEGHDLPMKSMWRQLCLWRGCEGQHA